MFHKQEDDLKLIHGLKERDENALNRCINRYHSYVSYIVGNIIGKSLPQEDKEEIIMDVFLAIWNHADSIDPDMYPSLKPYIGAIARNKSKNKLRSLSKYNTILLDDEILIVSNDFTESIIKSEIKEILLEAINMLSKEERVCFLKYYYYQKPIRIIAEETNLKESTIKSKLSRGRKKLKELLDRKGYNYEDFNI
ncbi:RNA polymerase sigma factor [Anaerocolumna sp. MB42-C2]|uniref:RNA polymerase sigma factor n=1 Tax=Anaerocolumna sp. MB42-C2 TaxID=3070997 RepID=UPI0027DF412D|nr:sigma-70 family RNA polymerase sigma factor [Anaerocolumna sp. MB42-C2]WMJ86471.1 sigma-70 family RNA polymerase sigma factor [Anaerocolumna sp. MB42-C2]